jgi:hypothetical protein
MLLALHQPHPNEGCVLASRAATTAHISSDSRLTAYFTFQQFVLSSPGNLAVEFLLGPKAWGRMAIPLGEERAGGYPQIMVKLRLEAKAGRKQPIVGPWMGRPDPTGEFAGIYYQFREWRDFSDVIQLPHTNELLFVDDYQPWLFLKRIGGIGQLDHPTEALVSNDIRLDDAEAITTDGQHFVYACTAHTLRKRDARSKKVHAFFRFRIEERNWLVQDGVISRLREALAAHYPFIRAVIDLRKKQGGLNIEGLVWDQANSRLLIGLRAPLLDGSACLVPIKVNPQTQFMLDNFDFQEPINLQIPGKGVRSIQFDPKLNSYLIITGNLQKGAGRDFGLWLWDGDSHQPARQVTSVKFRDYFNPEGVCPVKLSTGEEFIFIVSDDGGGYLKLRYEEVPLD